MREFEALPEEVRAQLLAGYQMGITPLMAHASALSPKGVGAQFVPDVRELRVEDAELFDPIGDDVHSPVPFLVHRYRNRVLWKLTATCAVYCRFCFRKELIGRKGSAPKAKDVVRVLDYLRVHEEVEEVIFSGGDPLTLAEHRLRRLLLALCAFKHVRRVRLHTRVPVVAPERLSLSFVDFCASLPFQVVWVLHVNHFDEFSKESDLLIARIREKMALFSQSVLLRGVNDSAVVLKRLYEAFFARGIRAYYLHHLDLARGTGHFRLSLQEGILIYKELRSMISSLLLPSYIVEIPGGGGKVPVLELSEAQRARLLDLGIF